MDDLDEEQEALLSLPPDVLLPSLVQHYISLTRRVRELECSARINDKRFDTLDTVWWKRLIFRVDGWGPWYRVRKTPKRRPWRRWWTS